jgi:hypothetical protein
MAQPKAPRIILSGVYYNHVFNTIIIHVVTDTHVYYELLRNGRSYERDCSRAAFRSRLVRGRYKLDHVDHGC